MNVDGLELITNRQSPHILEAHYDVLFLIHGVQKY